MTASEAREAAGWFQRESQRMQDVVDECAATGTDFKLTGLDYDERADRYRRASVALDAYADGIDAAAVEREACAAMIEAAAQRNAASAVGFPGASSEPWWTTRANALKSAAQAIRERGAK